jgi:uncharacterized coiled-coil DUF342 family protein
MKISNTHSEELIQLIEELKELRNEIHTVLEQAENSRKEIKEIKLNIEELTIKNIEISFK